MCRGRGQLLGQPCPDCRRTGRRKYESTVEVRVPPGTRHGDVITLKGEGNAGFKGFPPGDLVVCIMDERLGPVETIIRHSRVANCASIGR